MQNLQASWDRRESADTTAINLDKEPLSPGISSPVTAFQKRTESLVMAHTELTKQNQLIEAEKGCITDAGQLWQLWENREPDVETL